MVANRPESTRNSNKPGPAPIPTWILRFLLALSVPVILVGGGELLVRWLVPFPPSTFLIEEVRDGEVWVTDNPAFGYTFFHPRQARVPAQNLFRKNKPESTFRVLVLGESAAMGFPRPEFGLARMVRGMLEARYPGRAFDVIDGSMTMINSHILLDIAREALAYDPDVVLLYAGNNEAIGPYGPVGVFGRFYPARWMIRTDRWLRTHSQWVRFVVQGWSNLRNAEAPVWRGLDHFEQSPIRVDDPRVARMHRYFAGNLRAIVSLAREKGVPVVAASAAVNLAEWPPLQSLEPEGFTPVQHHQWSRLLVEAREAMTDGAWERAFDAWTAASQMAPDHAETQYGLARCQEAFGQSERARELDEQALLLDEFRFRADRILAERTLDLDRVEGCRSVDARTLFYTSPERDRFFLEHVHMTPYGLYQLASIFADQIKPLLASRGLGPAVDVSRDDLFQQLYLLPDILEESWAAVSLFLEMAVFRSQPGYARRILDVQHKHAAAQPAVEAIVPERIPELASLAMMAEDDSWRVDYLMARYLIRRDRPDLAVEPLVRATKAKPNHPDSFELLGYASYRAGDLPGATEALERALLINPSVPEAWNTLGLVWYLRGSREMAEDSYRKALSLNPMHSGALNNLGYLLFEQGKLREAVQLFRKALEANPLLVEARYHLGLALMNAGELEEALLHMREVVRTNPNLAKARNALGVLWLKSGQEEAAESQFQQALKIDPGLQEARINQAFIRLSKDRASEALPILQQVLIEEPENLQARYLHGRALALSGEMAPGLDALQKVLQAAPHRVDWLLETAHLYLDHGNDRPQALSEARALAERAWIASRQTSEEAGKLIETIDARETATFPSTLFSP